ncbi:MAG: hypothetical protein L0H64_04430 [Pseudonocardia sp.]|nr:hypothetical protein [Pseudonocardia sp.]
MSVPDGHGVADPTADPAVGDVPPLHAPADVRVRARAENVPVDADARPGLALAGAWVDTGWPDTMEGAACRGEAAAAPALGSPLSTRSRRTEVPT